jgi:hypothetical protein
MAWDRTPNSRLQGEMFHYKENLFFGRRKDGGVRILRFPLGGNLVIPQGAADVEDPLANVDLTIDSDGWASIVAAVSAGGEIDERYYAAKAFHESKGKVSIAHPDQPESVSSSSSAPTRDEQDEVDDADDLANELNCDVCGGTMAAHLIGCDR